MKKLFAIIMSALILTSFAACSNNSSSEVNTSKAEGTSSTVKAEESTTASDSESKASASDTSSASSKAESTSSTSSKSETTSSTAESSKNTSSETSSTGKLSNATMAKNAGDLLKDGLHNFFVELDKDKYRLEIDMSTTTSNSSKIVIITRDGDSISAATGTSKDNLSKSIVKNNKGYVIDDEEKTVTWSDFEEGYAESYTEYLAQLFYITDIEKVKSGKEKFGSNEMDFEEYKIVANESSESSETEDQYVRYYFENKEFKGMKIINGNDYYALRITSMTHDIPAGEFDYPSSYKLVQAEEYSYEIDGDSSAT